MNGMRMYILAPILLAVIAGCHLLIEESQTGISICQEDSPQYIGKSLYKYNNGQDRSTYPSMGYTAYYTEFEEKTFEAGETAFYVDLRDILVYDGCYKGHKHGENINYYYCPARRTIPQEINEEGFIVKDAVDYYVTLVLDNMEHLETKKLIEGDKRPTSLQATKYLVKDIICMSPT